MLAPMSSRQPWSLAALLAVQAAACNPDGAASTTGTSDPSTSDSTGAASTTGTPTTGTTATSDAATTSTTATSDAPTTSTTATTTSDGSATTSTTTSASSGPQSTTDGTTTGESSSGASDSSTGATGGTTGGVEPFSSFTCTELTLVDLLLREAISGSFTADGVPIDVLAVMVKGGATDFQIDIAGPVAPDDPYAADVAFWEQDLTAIGWDVNPPGPPAGDRRYIFIPEGAQFVAKFSLFYYRIYEGGGNGQFEFECLKQ